MGDIADMMLDGTLCEGCGEYIGDATGFPGYCSPKCAAGRGADYTPFERVKVKRVMVSCPKCGKRVKEIGLPDHTRDKHGSPS